MGHSHRSASRFHLSHKQSESRDDEPEAHEGKTRSDPRKECSLGREIHARIPKLSGLWWFIRLQLHPYSLCGNHAGFRRCYSRILLRVLRKAERTTVEGKGHTVSAVWAQPAVAAFARRQASD